MTLPRGIRLRTCATAAVAVLAVIGGTTAFAGAAHADDPSTTPTAGAEATAAADPAESAAAEPTAAAATASAPSSSTSLPFAGLRAKDPNLGNGTLKLSAYDIADGQTIKLTGTGYPKVATNMFITVCKNPPTATDCNVDLSRVVTVHYNGSGSWKATFTVHTTFELFGPPKELVNCAKVECVVGSTNAANPKDHAYNAVAVFTVKGASSGSTKTNATKTTTTTKTSTGSTTSTGTGSTSAQTTSGGAALPQTGVTPLTPASGVAGLLLVVSGAALIAYDRRRKAVSQV